MGTRRVNKKTFSCGHKGFGDGYCHRCEQADVLEALLKDGKPYITDKKKPKPVVWGKKKMEDEIKRLREGVFVLQDAAMDFDIV